MVAPELAGLASFLGTEYLSNFYRMIWKKCSIAALKKRGSREDEKNEKHLKKIKVYNHEKYSKVQIATSTFWVSSLSPQFPVINVYVNFVKAKKMLTQKSVDLINNFVLENFSLFCRVALKNFVPSGKQSKEPPIWKAPLYHCNYLYLSYYQFPATQIKKS